MGKYVSIKKIAEKNNITIKELAAKTGMPATTLYSLADKPVESLKLENIRKIAKALNTNVDDLIGGVDAFDIGDAFTKLGWEDCFKEMRHIFDHEEVKHFKTYVNLDTNNKKQVDLFTENLSENQDMINELLKRQEALKDMLKDVTPEDA